MNTPSFLIVHHTGGTDANPKADTSHHTAEIINEWHKKLWNFRSSLGWYVGYHYVISKEGKVTQCRAHTDDGAHTIGMNSSSVGIVLCGNFDYYLPTNAQVEALRKLLKRLTKELVIPAGNVVPHRRFAQKTCYGSKLSDTWAQELVVEGSPVLCTLDRFTTSELTAELIRRIRGT